MVSFMFSSHQISSSTCLRGQPLSLSYSLVFNRLYLFSFDSVLSFEQETRAKQSRGGPCLVYRMPTTFSMKVLSFLLHVDFFEKTDQEIVSIEDISRYIAIKYSISWRFRGHGHARYLLVQLSRDSGTILSSFGVWWACNLLHNDRMLIKSQSTQAQMLLIFEYFEILKRSIPS